MTALEYNAKFARAEGFAAGLPPQTDCGGVAPESAAFERCAREFQRKHKLEVDGYFGPSTWARWLKFHAALLPSRGTLIAAGRAIATELEIVNYLSPDVGRFKRYKRRKSITQIVVHESVTKSASSAVDILQRKGLGCHFVIDAGGELTQHADLLDDSLVHCPNWNSRSIGVEVINPYYTKYKTGPWASHIDAPWAHRGEYVLATLAQCKTLVRLVRELTEGGIEGLEIPTVWCGLRGGMWYLGVVPSANKKQAGIWSHQQTGTHADGSWPVLVAYLAIEQFGGDVDLAWQRALVVAADALSPLRVRGGSGGN